MSAARKKPSRARLPRAEWLVGLTLFLVVGFLAVLTVLVVRQNADLHTQSADLHTANKARDALAAQVQRLGGKPVAGPPGSRGNPGQSKQGPRGPKGETGKPGESAPAITPSPGASGEPGEDSTVPGPASTVSGPPGQPGQDATGVPGQDGKDGTNGVDGRNGSDGKPPAGWTFQYGGVTYTCQPADGFDPDAPQYRCETPEPDPDSGGSESTPLSMGLDPGRRKW